MEFDIKEYETLLTLVISVVALVISIIALHYTINSFLLKKGHRIRCDISTYSTIECDDKYISSITLENTKDRSTVIFSIYLKLGRNNFLLLEDFEHKPLILKPFEVYYKEFEPILFYSANMSQVKLDKLLNNDKVTHRIILSTTDGRYTVKASTKKWSPMSQFFKNFFTAIINPVRLSYNGKAYGSNVKYLVEFKKRGDENYVIVLHEGDDKLKKFQNLQFTKDSLQSKEKLKSFLLNQKSKKVISFDEIDVIDFQEKINKATANYRKEKVELEAYSFFRYYIVGRVITILENRKLEKKNNRIKNTAHNRIAGR